MKKMFNVSFYYMIAGLIGGVFFREFTKIQGFTGNTALGVVHTHTLMLGMFMFLIVGIIVDYLKITDDKRIKKFFIWYNTGLILTITMLVVRGVFDVLGTNLSKGLNASISGMSGLGHIVLTVGLMYFFTAIRKAVKDR
ncbi:DUF2871 domain-containing protein [Erysipelothrix inopinata]|uniref:DUF2871 domain-containing protein n=1 Tax=Erysipelothrix inopinata TaxID=225084 RepID=A0A7G9RX25_9FIRM|nr:DUF2871 domain-containing protein [Erysipelothrix inopinata]QNN60150.1 DUF2871 domain-containing protein [Erysipelothrix inopinata]